MIIIICTRLIKRKKKSKLSNYYDNNILHRSRLLLWMDMDITVVVVSDNYTILQQHLPVHRQHDVKSLNSLKLYNKRLL